MERLLKQSFDSEQSINYSEEKGVKFYDKYHYHPECEITYIEKGEGLRIVGGRIEKFEAGEVVFLGSNLPHVWKSTLSTENLDSDAHMPCHSQVLHFLPDVFGHEFLALPEMREIAGILDKARKGLKLSPEKSRQIVEKMSDFRHIDHFNRILNLLQMLRIIAYDINGKELSNYFTALPRERNPHRDRITDVYEFTIQHYQQEIKLNEVAGVASMSPTAFCRYFKQKTGKTYNDFLNEIRVHHACKLLANDDWSIARIGYESGYGNLTNFNRQFKRITGVVPMVYKERFS